MEAGASSPLPAGTCAPTVQVGGSGPTGVEPNFIVETCGALDVTRIMLPPADRQADVFSIFYF